MNRTSHPSSSDHQPTRGLAIKELMLTTAVMAILAAIVSGLPDRKTSVTKIAAGASTGARTSADAHLASRPVDALFAPVASGTARTANATSSPHDDRQIGTRTR